jgi:hypothetical protein
MEPVQGEEKRRHCRRHTRDPAMLLEEGEEWLQDNRLAYEKNIYLVNGRKRKALSQKHGF